MRRSVVSVLVASCCVVLLACGRKETPPAAPVRAEMRAAPAAATPGVTAPTPGKGVVSAPAVGSQVPADFDRALAQIQSQIDAARYADALAALRQESNNPKLTMEQRARFRAMRDALADQVTRSLADVRTLVVKPAPSAKP